MQPPRFRDCSHESPPAFAGVHSRSPSGYGKESGREIAPYTPGVALSIGLALSILFTRGPNFSGPGACSIDSKIRSIDVTDRK